MSSSACRWGRSRWPTSPASTSAGTATRTGSRTSATRSARSTAGARRRAPASTIMTRSAGRRPSPVVQQIIEDFAKKQGVERREISDEEIVERTLYTMVNEGAKILEEGIAQRASDIDVVWVYGYGWPVYRGGPMFWADTRRARQDRRGPEAPGRADEAASSASRKLLLDKAEKGEKLHALNAARSPRRMTCCESEHGLYGRDSTEQRQHRSAAIRTSQSRSTG